MKKCFAVAVATWFLGPVFVLSVVQSAQASLPKAPNAGVGGSEDVQQKIQLLDLRKAAIEDRLREKSKLFYQLMHSAGAAQFSWFEADEAVNKRKRVEEILRVAIREQIKEIDAIDGQKSELLAEQEWLKVQESETIPLPSLAKADELMAPDNKISFSCSSLPVEPADNAPLQLAQDFGLRKDNETGLQWNSLGWWLSQVGKEVKSCATGTVVYSGHVAGRGRVLMLDHGHGDMTLYANLNDDPNLSFKKGEVVKAGKVIGTPRERVYFEVRRNGLAVNPRTVLSTQKLTKVGL